ncbi:hypothetical protein PchlO6_3234 [Pseudomonas chlororaphis O6]|uniref:Secreted protein n=1 Tax=Pseudomonas chlororaphis O6 TaxID=1037915 RepID=A0AB33WP27_9PSED|nr:hypothetical protein PchlO6_3234 [Pseudomonas chlororaphis O6]
MCRWASCRWASASSFLSLAFSGSIFCRRYEFREIPRRVHQQPVSVRVKQLEIFRSSAGGVLDRSKGLRIRLSWIIWITLLRSRRELRQSDRGLASNLPPTPPKPPYRYTHNVYYVKSDAMLDMFMCFV